MTKRIAFQGEPGAYSHQACHETFPGMEVLPCRTFEDAFAAVEKGDAALDATWQWPSGQKVELRMVPPTRARSIAVRLTYSAAHQTLPD